MHVRHLRGHRYWNVGEIRGPRAIWLHPFPFLSLSYDCVVVSSLSGSVLTVYLSFSYSHRWVLSCISNLWLSDSPAPHFLLLPWLGTSERGSGLIRYLQVGRGQIGFCYICSFHAVLILTCFYLYCVHSHDIVQLQSGVWRRVDEDIRQSVPLICHPIWHRKKRGRWGRK